jgi:hypothetical protein
MVCRSREPLVVRLFRIVALFGLLFAFCAAKVSLFGNGRIEVRGGDPDIETLESALNR